MSAANDSDAERAKRVSIGVDIVEEINDVLAKYALRGVSPFDLAASVAFNFNLMTQFAAPDHARAVELRASLIDAQVDASTFMQRLQMESK